MCTVHMLKRAEVPDAHWKQADEEGRQSQPQLQENEVPMQKLLSSLHNANKTKTNRKVRTHSMQDFEALSSIALAAFRSPLFSHPSASGLVLRFGLTLAHCQSHQLLPHQNGTGLS